MTGIHLMALARQMQAVWQVARTNDCRPPSLLYLGPTPFSSQFRNDSIETNLKQSMISYWGGSLVS
jgi:hypothetical protein